MKVWNFKVKSNPQEIAKKLGSTFLSVDGFVFKMVHGNNDSVVFNLRKRVLFPDQLLHRNRIRVSGKFLKADTGNETDVEIAFTQHFFITWTAYLYIGLGIFAIILGVTSNVPAFMPVAVILAIGIGFWIFVHKKFEKEIQEYKTLISEILAL